MKKIIWIYGIIPGIVASAWCAISVRTLSDNVSLDTRTWLGYTSMIVSLSIIFAAVKNYRDNHNNGVITFGKAFKVGALITLVASTIYVIFWLISYNFFFPNFIEKYSMLMRRQMQADGATQAQINSELADMASYGKMYKNPIFNILITYTEIAPVGLVISLIAALILKKDTNGHL